MMRRAARRASRHGGRAHAAAEQQLSLDLGEASRFPELFAVGAPTETHEALVSPNPPSVLDATERLARAAAERSRHARDAKRETPAASAEEWFDIGCELEAEHPDEAQTAYHRALALEPEMADAHVNLGRVYHETGEHAKAEAHYRAATQHAPRDPIAWFNLAVLLEDLHRAEEAVQAYHSAIERDNEHADAHYNLGLLYDELGNRSEAMSHLMQARRLYRLNPRN